MAKFLVLPGYLQSGKILAEKGSTFRKLMTKLNHQLDYIDPPVIIEKYQDLVFSLGDSEEECNAKWQKIVESNANRCWFQHSDTNGYVKFDESYNYLVKYLKENGPYDGIIGFSQGSGIMLTIMNNPDFNFKLCMSFSGFCFTVPADEKDDRININYQIEDPEEYNRRNIINKEYTQYYKNKPTTKLFNIFGDSDMVVPKVRSTFVNSIYPNVENFEFEGGHMMPNKKPFLRPLIERIQEVLESSD
ncbi:family of serine hydrolases 1 [[Candida] jaroonii]|uniref:Family of serine hydrolases 1 n=1 Tax=[Candida] jaroonii TaxID=467808 RepID=A0ACA9Y0D9_9ASCO|nr:family of serine hydrolases 1 [[Candida] jaroonii]